MDDAEDVGLLLFPRIVTDQSGNEIGRDQHEKEREGKLA
jgi:hypothetical protein